MLSAEIAKLRAQLNKNSSNSSKQHSSDTSSKKIRSMCEPSGKKPSAQPGHKAQAGPSNDGGIDLLHRKP
ncbi:MAG: DUF6444 domain-containing protein [Burkholderiaceae bacterium]